MGAEGCFEGSLIQGNILVSIGVESYGFGVQAGTSPWQEEETKGGFLEEKPTVLGP